MKLILYQSDGSVFDLVEVVNPLIEGNNITWEGGSMLGVGLPFLLLDDIVEIGEVITDEIKANDRSQEFRKVTDIELARENTLLKAQMQAASERSDFHEELIAEMAMMVYP